MFRTENGGKFERILFDKTKETFGDQIKRNENQITSDQIKQLKIYINICKQIAKPSLHFGRKITENDENKLAEQ